MRDGIVIMDVPIESVKVTVARNGAQRRVCTVKTTQTPATLTALTNWQNPFAPAGNEIRPWFVLQYPNGTTEEVPLFTGPIITTTVIDTGVDLVVEMQASDRSYLLQESKLLQPYTAAADQSLDEAIASMCQFAWTGRGTLPIAIQPTTALVPSTGWVVKAGKNIWAVAQEIGASAGYEVYFDAWGTLSGNPIPDPTTRSPVWATGGQISGLKLATLKATRKKVYSVMGVVGTGSELVADKKGILRSKHVPIYGQAQVTDPSSPINPNTGFGVVGNLVRIVTVTSAEQAQTIAANALTLQVGHFAELGIGAIPNPALDVDDVVAISAPRLGVQGNFVVDGWDFTMSALGVPTMNLTIRPVGQSSS